MEKLKYLNIGCGSKYHKSWVNIDMGAFSSDIKEVNVLKGLPFRDNSFDVVYHSQVLEHIPREKAEFFIKECYRVLKKEGIIRVVVPDLENIIDEYKKLLNENLNNPTEASEANYEWIMIEMIDQIGRNHFGGQMLQYLKQKEIVNEKFVYDRIGLIGKNFRENYFNKTKKESKIKFAFSSFRNFVISVKFFTKKGLRIFSTKKAKIGAYRLSGEVHNWMYDRYSLSKLLKDCDFEQIQILNPHKSNIPEWEKYELDVKNNEIYDPTSLFMEAVK